METNAITDHAGNPLNGTRGLPEVPDSEIPSTSDIELPPREGDSKAEEDEAKTIANIPHIFEVKVGDEVVKLPLYPQPPGYMILIADKLFDIVSRATSLQSDKIWKQLKKFVEKKGQEEIKEGFVAWVGGAVDEAQEVFQLLFETGPYDGTFTVLSEDVFKWSFTVPLMTEILEVFLKQNDMSRIVKKMVRFSQGQAGLGQV